MRNVIRRECRMARIPTGSPATHNAIKRLVTSHDYTPVYDEPLYFSLDVVLRV